LVLSCRCFQVTDHTISNQRKACLCGFGELPTAPAETTESVMERFAEGLTRHLSSRAMIDYFAVHRTGEDAQELSNTHRLRQKTRGAASREAIDLLTSRISADNHDRDVTRCVVRLQLVQHIPTWQIRKVQIEEDKVRGVFAGKIEADSSLHRGEQFDVLLTFKQFFHQH